MKNLILKIITSLLFVISFSSYSFGIDSVKKLLITEILVFPSLIRRELVSNVLSYPGLTQNLRQFVDTIMDQQLDPAVVIEVGLLKDLKLRRFSMDSISDLAKQSGLSPLH